MMKIALTLGATLATMAVVGLLSAKHADETSATVPAAVQIASQDLAETQITDYTFEFPLTTGDGSAGQ